MKKKALKLANIILNPIGAKIVRKSSGEEYATFSMSSMLLRLGMRNIPIQTVFDIGASDGQWSVASMPYLKNTNYLAVEPLVEREAALCHIKSRFANFDYSICVAGDVDGKNVVLKVTEDLDGSTVDGSNLGVSRTCQCRTIDSLAAEKHFTGPYLLKFDTHGYEKPILAGCVDVLKNTVAIIMETYNFQLTPASLRFHEMCAHMETLGFRVADIADPMLRPHDRAFWQIDILFVRSDFEMFHQNSYS